MNTPDEKARLNDPHSAPMSLALHWTYGQGAQIQVNDAVCARLGGNVQQAVQALYQRLLADLPGNPLPPPPSERELPPLLRKLAELAALQQEAALYAEGGPVRRDLDERVASLRAEIEPVLRQQEGEQIDRSIHQRTHSLLMDELAELDVRRKQTQDPAERAALDTEYQHKRAVLLDLLAKHRDLAGYGLVAVRAR